MSDTKRRPDFVIRAKLADSEFWTTCGAVWSFTNGKPGFAVRFNQIPTGWDGTAILVPPLTDEEEPSEPVKGKKK